MEDIHVGTLVKWVSQSQKLGGTQDKVGKVVMVIPALSQFPLVELKRKYGSTHRFVSYGHIRAHESYVVEVEHLFGTKPVLYWPRAASLQAC